MTLKRKALAVLDTVVLTLLILLALPSVTTVHAGLPSKTYEIDGGTIVIQGGVTRNFKVQPTPIGRMRYPTEYFLNLDNNTSQTIWTVAEFRFPKKTSTSFTCVIPTTPQEPPPHANN